MRRTGQYMRRTLPAALLFAALLLEPCAAQDAPQPTVADGAPQLQADATAEDRAQQEALGALLAKTTAAAKAQASQGNYAGAAALFVQAGNGTPAPLDAGREAFLAMEPGTRLSRTTETGITRARAAIRDYGALQQRLEAARTQMAAAAGNAAQASRTFTATMRPALQSLAAVRNRAFAEAEAVAGLSAELPEDAPGAWKSYLGFLAGCLAGGDGSIVGVMDAQWQALMDASLSAADKEALSLAQSLAAALDGMAPGSQEHAAADECLGAMERLIPLLTDGARTNLLLDAAEGDAAQAKRTAYEASVQGFGQLAAKTRTLLATADDLAARIARDTALAPDKDSADIAADVRNGTDSLSRALIAQANDFASRAARIGALGSEAWIRDLDAAGTDAPRWEKATAAYVAASGRLASSATQAADLLLTAAGTRLVAAARQMCAEDAEKYGALKGLIPADGTDDAKQYPTKLIGRQDSYQEALRADREALATAAGILSGADGSLAERARELQKRIEDSRADLLRLSAQGTALLTQARTQQREALSARNEIDVSYNQSLAAYRQENFSRAQASLDRALSIYDSSIESLKQDSDMLTETYARLVALKQVVAEGQKPLLIQEIRVLKNRAREAYYAGNFEEAGNILNQAEESRENWSRFMDVELDADQELERLKTMVNTALAIQEGRELNPQSALYPEMSQILSISNQYYEQGMALMQAGKRSDARDLLNQAKAKLEELKIVYPRNQQANLLSLRIDQVLDAKQFNESFRKKFNELRGINYALLDSAAQVGYADLQDLHALQPSYPGLADFIYQVELDMGIRQRPIDTSALEEAQALADEAQKIVETAGRDAAQLEGAKSLANQALALNPDNDTAVAVLDEIALRTGAEAAVVLSAADEEKYQKAVTYLQGGNVVAANAALQDLLQNATNRRSAKVIKLQSRIEGMLQ